MKLSFAKTVLYEVLQVQIKTVSCKSRMFFVLLWTSLTFCHLVVFKSVYCTDVSVKVLFIYLFIYFILFYFILFFLLYCIGFAIHQHKYAMGTHVFPILNPSPTSLPPCTIPLGHPIAPAPSILYHASDLDWRFISHMMLYMFQCHSPKSSHRRPLPESKRLFYV